MRNFLMGLMVGLGLSFSVMANAGVMSHVAAYEIGKHNARKEAMKDCACPDGAKGVKTAPAAVAPAAPAPTPAKPQ